MVDKAKFRTRFYNQIDLVGDSIIKTSTVDRILIEKQWFEFASKYISKSLPNIQSVKFNVDNASIAMEYIPYDNVYHQILENKLALSYKELMISVQNIRDNLYLEKSEVNYDDIIAMYLEKPLAALEYLYNQYPYLKKVQTINDTKCISPDILIPELFSILKSKLTDTNFAPIHGDMTLSNMIVDNKGDLFIFDPRGKFGKTNIIGDVRYDIAKLYFSIINNFDSLNYHKYTFEDINDHNESYRYYIDNITHSQDPYDAFFEVFLEEKEIILYISCTIWLSLFPHLCESKAQSVVAFLHGTYLLNNLYSNITKANRE